MTLQLCCCMLLPFAHPTCRLYWGVGRLLNILFHLKTDNGRKPFFLDCLEGNGSQLRQVQSTSEYSL